MHVSLAVLGGATTETEKAVSQPVGKRGPKGGRGKRKRKALHDEDEEEEDMDSLEGGVVMETGREHTIVRLLKLFVKVSKDGERWGKELLQAGSRILPPISPLPKTTPILTHLMGGACIAMCSI